MGSYLRLRLKLSSTCRCCLLRVDEIPVDHSAVVRDGYNCLAPKLSSLQFDFRANIATQTVAWRQILVGELVNQGMA